MTLSFLKLRPPVLAPLSALAGAALALAVDQGQLPYQDLFLPGLSLAAFGLVAWGLQGVRRSRGLFRYLHLLPLLGGGWFFVARLYYLLSDMRWLDGQVEQLPYMTAYRQQLTEQLWVAGGLFVAAILFGLLPKSSSRPRSTPKSGRGRQGRRPRTASVEASRLIKLLRR